VSTHGSLHTLKGTLRGELIEPGDSGYDEARKVYNAMIDKRPALIVRCVDTADVIASVNYARANDMVTAIRGGGHNGGGLGTCDDGIVIDLSHMRGVTVDPVRQTARANGGALLSELDRAGQEHGLVCPVGVVGHTGVVIPARRCAVQVRLLDRLRCKGRRPDQTTTIGQGEERPLHQSVGMRVSAHFDIYEKVET